MTDVIPRSASQQRDLANGVFYQYVQRLKASGDFVSEAKSQLSFVKENEIEYLIVSKNGVLPSVLKEVIDRTIVDELSQERFVILR